MNATRMQEFRSENAAELTVINLFTPKAGRLDDFVAAQKAGLPSFRGQVPGLRYGSFYRSLDGKTAVLISVFESPAHFEQFRGSELFAAYRDTIVPLLERSDPGLYTLVYESGNVGHPAGR
jgi:quinol monooxygenase YgiN